MTRSFCLGFAGTPCGAPCDGSRCPTHQRERDRAIAERKAPAYAGNWDAQSLRIRKAHVAEHGLMCPGWRSEPHGVGSIAELAVDHDELKVYCRSCNGSKGGGYDKQADSPAAARREARAAGTGETPAPAGAEYWGLV